LIIPFLYLRSLLHLLGKKNYRKQKKVLIPHRLLYNQYQQDNRCGGDIMRLIEGNIYTYKKASDCGYFCFLGETGNRKYIHGV